MWFLSLSAKKSKLPSSATELLLSKSNVDEKKFIQYATSVARVATKNKVDNLSLVHNSRDVEALSFFDFSKQYVATHSSIAHQVDRNSTALYTHLVGDSVKNPMWTKGTGIEILKKLTKV